MTDRAEPGVTPLTAVCQWCGVRLLPEDGTWTGPDGSGDYCEEGLAVGRTGTSPHLPTLDAATPRPGLVEFKERANATHAMPSFAAYYALVEDMLAALAPGTGEPGLDVPRQWSEGWEPRCDDDFYCGECPDCLSGEHPENRPPTP